MPPSLKDVEQLARALAAEDRTQLAEALLESLQIPPLSDVEIADGIVIFAVAHQSRRPGYWESRVQDR